MKVTKIENIAEVWEEYSQNKDLKIRNVLIHHYLPVVKYTAERLHSRFPKSVELDDLVSVGLLGMIKAIDKFDPHRGVLFETYSTQRIHGEIIDDLRKKDWIPRLVRDRAKKLEKATQKLKALLGRMPSDKELADEFNMNQKEFSHFQRDANALGLFSLHSALSEGGSDNELQEINLIADKKSQDPFQASLKNDIREFILKGFQREEKLVIVLYYFEEMTMKEVGKTLGISESRVCQIHTSIISRLKSKIDNSPVWEALMAEGA